MALSREEVVAQLSIAMSVDKTMQAADLAETAIDGQARTIAPPPKVQSTAGERAKMMLAQASRARRDQLHLLEPLGQGGMGVVRSAKQPTLGRHVAVKMLRSGSTEEEAMISMLREAWVTGTLEHPNIVPVYYVDADEEGRPLIVLKRIEGVEWSTLMSNSEAVRERFGATELLEWNLGVLDAVINAIRYAHSRGILHRDLKPENVMVGEFGEVYVLDWGIAVSLEDDGHTLRPLLTESCRWRAPRFTWLPRCWVMR